MSELEEKVELQEEEIQQLESNRDDLREDQEASGSAEQDIINTLIDERNKECKRADLLQANLDKVKQFYFDEIGVLQAEIARLKLKVKH